MVYTYRIGEFTLISASSTLVVIDKGGMAAYDGWPLALGSDFPRAVAKRKKPGKHKRPGKRTKGRRPVGDCPKCGRVFFVRQGIKSHVQFCKGTKGEK